MEKIYKNALNERIKISLDLEDSTLEFIDLLANVTKSSRITIIEAIIGKGAMPLINEIESNWKTLLIKGNFDEGRKNNIKKLIAQLEKAKNKFKEL